MKVETVVMNLDFVSKPDYEEVAEVHGGDLSPELELSLEWIHFPPVLMECTSNAVALEILLRDSGGVREDIDSVTKMLWDGESVSVEAFPFAVFAVGALLASARSQDSVSQLFLDGDRNEFLRALVDNYGADPAGLHRYVSDVIEYVDGFAPKSVELVRGRIRSESDAVAFLTRPEEIIQSEGRDANVETHLRLCEVGPYFAECGVPGYTVVMSLRDMLMMISAVSSRAPGSLSTAQRESLSEIQGRLVGLIGDFMELVRKGVD